MVVCNWMTHYNRWIEKQIFHPIWLNLREKEAQQKYDTWLYNQVYHYSKIGCFVTWIIFII